MKKKFVICVFDVHMIKELNPDNCFDFIQNDETVKILII